MWQASAELRDKPVARSLPQVTLQEMLLAFKEVAVRAAMFAHHHVRREPLSVRERMSNILAALEHGSFVEFSRLFVPEEGRAGVTVSFIAILELMREGLIDITQTEAYAPLHVRASAANRTLHLVADNALPEPAAPAAVRPMAQTSPPGLTTECWNERKRTQECR